MVFRCSAIAALLLLLLVVAIAPFGSSAFSSVPHTAGSAAARATSSLFANSDNIKAAMEATEMYGIHSPQAKLAWEIVEEYDASTNDSAAFTPSGGGLSPEALEQAYLDVGASMELMRTHRYAAASFRDNQQLMRDVASELKAIKLAPPAQQPAPRIPGLWDSKLKARAMTQQYGASSPEARLAWEEVEEIASTGLERSIGGAAAYGDESCDLIQAAEACMALEELDRFLYQENYPSGDNLGDPNDTASIDDFVAKTMSDYSMSDYKENYNQKFDQDYNQKYNNQTPNPSAPDQNYSDPNYDYNYGNADDGNYYSDNGGAGGTYY